MWVIWRIETPTKQTAFVIRGFWQEDYAVARSMWLTKMQFKKHLSCYWTTLDNMEKTALPYMCRLYVNLYTRTVNEAIRNALSHCSDLSATSRSGSQPICIVLRLHARGNPHRRTKWVSVKVLTDMHSSVWTSHLRHPCFKARHYRKKHW